MFIPENTPLGAYVWKTNVRKAHVAMVQALMLPSIYDNVEGVSTFIHE